MKTSFDRRAFFKRAVTVSASFVLASRFGKLLPLAEAATKGAAKAAALPAGEKLIEASDPVASAIGYKHNPSKKDHPAGQQCDGCALYAKVNDNWGHCQMLMGKGVVNAHDWCRSWNKK